MRKAISLLIATSLVLTTLWFGSSHISAQKPRREPPATENQIDKALRKNWDRLPPEFKKLSDPKLKADWEKLTPRQHELLRTKVREIIATESKKYEDDKAAERAALNSWDDVIKLAGQKGSEDETLTFTDEKGQSRTVKAKRRGGTLTPSPHANRDSRLGQTPGSTKPVWENNWAFAKGISTAKPRTKSHHAVGSARALTQAGCSRGPEQFLRTFYGGLFNSTSYEGAFARPPSATELSDWLNTFAQAQSQGTLLNAAQNLGWTLFQSPEYASRGRSNYEFVYDCYVAYLQRLPDQSGWNFWTANTNANGRAATLMAFAVSSEFSDVVNSLCNVSSFDGDQDGLPDNFENSLANAFTPEYHISYGEPDSYATMQDFVPQTLKRAFGANPVSHFRVTPVAITVNPHNGQLESYLRIDYLTLWDHDSGLVGGLGCAFGLAPFLEGLESHPLDDERSALLVSAPAPNGIFNTDPNAYHSLSVYTAAHEGTFGDQSMYHDYPTTPIGAGYHVPLWESLQKHSTYTFDPDFWPILQFELQFIIITVITVIFGYFCNNWNDPFWDDFGVLLTCEAFWVFAYYEAFTIIYTCAVERFNSGGTGGMVSLASTRINVGETTHPINGSAFIQDNAEAAFHLRDKLENPLQFQLQIP
jgi:hypothetical protein